MAISYSFSFRNVNFNSQIITDSKGKSYLVYHHIDVASTLFFEPVIVKWTVEIREPEENDYRNHPLS